MKVKLEKLLSYNDNKYIFCKAAMQAVEKINNLKSHDEEALKDEKIVIATLNYLLDEKIKFNHHLEEN